MGAKIPSPCVGICKYKLAGHCIGCGMSKKQKKAFKKLNGRKSRQRFVQYLIVQQEVIGLKADWQRAYRRRCHKKGAACPLDSV